MRKTIATIFFVIALLFIFAQSVMPPEISSFESNFVMNLLGPVLEFFLGAGNVTSFSIRKIAHYTEYAILGLFAAFILRKEDRGNIKRFVIGIGTCLLIAILDETIQIFTNRGPAILDVWIDTAGAIVGLVVGLLI